jgi:hypothetical protein
MSLLELAERCERAEGPDRELDARIAELAIANLQVLPAGTGAWLVLEDGRQRDASAVPAYTASLDVAMTLVPEGNLPRRLYIRDEATAVFLGDLEALAATPALALCAAALRARHAMQGQPDEE